MIDNVKFNSIHFNPYMSFKANDNSSVYISDPIAPKYDMQGAEALANYNKASLVKSSKQEKFNDVFNEMCASVPDSTSTIEEKELALSYIDRILGCKDITPDLKNYWSNKKDIIEMEIQTIKNEKDDSHDYNKIADEWSKCVDKYWDKEPTFENVPDRVEYYQSYYSMYISFCDKMLACEKLPEDMRNEWSKMKQNALFDLKNHNNDLKRYYNENH